MAMTGYVKMVDFWKPGRLFFIYSGIGVKVSLTAKCRGDSGLDTRVNVSPIQLDFRNRVVYSSSTSCAFSYHTRELTSRLRNR